MVDLTPLVPIPAGRFLMGSAEFSADETPVHVREVATFELEQHPVTNEQFAAFVADTGYVTVAERDLDPADFPGVDPAVLVPGGLVFTPTAGPVDLGDWSQWWRWRAGATWREPGWPGPTADERPRHPVVMVAYEDAATYAAWAGRRLPTEAEFEYAARGGLEGARFAWGDEEFPGGRLMVNRWQGRFPYENTGAAGWVGPSPVGTFPPNGYGLVDMTGNVWEWTTDAYAPRHVVPGLADTAVDAGGRRNLLGSASGETSGEASEVRRVLKGGSHLCSPEYCLRYRPAARSPQSEDTATTHIGFRCAR
ncbi:formylglycine-generating enzyme family protein [Agromyces intestinalis]|uniref:formylglycine-generating enzyme family protein n=1 Tax=Agromyces intestinalis TaxID=2592652 RepID=UPI001AF00427|nr:formylglycine-generating enzyme family protein [Agromyces intestinalis]